MGLASKFFWQNLTRGAGAVLSASSALVSMPVVWLRDPVRSKRWRSHTGWSIVRGWNDQIPLAEATSGRLVPYVEPGTYATGDALATAIATALNDKGVHPATLSPSAWWRADSLTATLSEGAAVTAWASRSGALSLAATGTPRYYATVANGRPGVRFTAGSHMQVANATWLSGLLGAQGRGTVVCVWYADATQTGVHRLWRDAADKVGQEYDAQAGGNIVVTARGDDGASKTAAKTRTLDSRLFVAWWSADGTNIKSWADDADDADAATTAMGNQTGLSASTLYVGGQSAELEGYLAELIFFPAVLTETQRQQVTRYLVQRYRLTADTTTVVSAGTGVYTCAYDATAQKFSVTRASGAEAFDLRWTGDSGAWSSMIGVDLGWATATDITGQTGTVTATVATVQSRHWLGVDLGAVRWVSASAALAGNMPVGALSLRGSAKSVAAALASPDYTVALGSGVDPLFALFDAVAYRYWALVVDDRQNVNGYAELGVWYVGGYFEPSNQWARGIDANRHDLSAVSYSDHGVPYQDKRQSPRGWALDYEMLTEADAAQIDTMLDYVSVGGPFFFQLESAASPQYMHFPSVPSRGQANTKSRRWSWSIKLVEAMG